MMLLDSFNSLFSKNRQDSAKLLLTHLLGNSGERELMEHAVGTLVSHYLLYMTFFFFFHNKTLHIVSKGQMALPNFNRKSG